MNSLTEALLTIVMGIIGVAILSTLVSKKANTSAVLAASGNAFSNSLATAMGGVTGYSPSGNSQYNINQFGG